MGVLDIVMQLRGKGFSDEEIINHLRQEKISPKEINDAISQANIKKAVSSEEALDFDGMEPSIMQNSQEEIPIPRPEKISYSPKTKEINESRYAPYSQQPISRSQTSRAMTIEQESPQEYSQPQSPEYDYNYSQENGTASDTDTMIEVSEQVFDEKISETLNQLESINKFKGITETKVDSFENRLRKIESMMDKLQIAILEKVGSYGENLESIKKEMGMMQDSFGKMVNPIINSKNINDMNRRQKLQNNEEFPIDYETGTSNISSDISSIMKPKKKISGRR